EEEAQKIYDFGIALGMAFQIQDDYLDAFGDPKSFGKQLGGDIIENKKTILYHKALHLGTEEQKKELDQWFDSKGDIKAEEKIEAVKQLFIATTAAEASQELMQNYTQQAFELLEVLRVNEQGGKVLRTFANQLMQRQS
ncbi:MAG: polyprenyl synthetase family protein, partial [Flavobacteriaceae bacterium]